MIMIIVFISIYDADADIAATDIAAAADDGVITCHPNHSEDACSNRSKNCGRPPNKNCQIFQQNY